MRAGRLGQDLTLSAAYKEVDEKQANNGKHPSSYRDSLADYCGLWYCQTDPLDEQLAFPWGKSRHGFEAGMTWEKGKSVLPNASLRYFW